MATSRSTKNLYRGEPAISTHFHVLTPLYEAAAARAKEEGTQITDLVRAALADYGKNTKPSEGPTGPATLPKAGVDGLKKAAKSGIAGLVNAYMAALEAEGWSLAVIGQGAVDAGISRSMSRQAVQQRVDRANSKSPMEADLMPPVPPVGPRRAYPTRDHVPGGTRGLSQKGERMNDVKDVPANVPVSTLEPARARAKRESAKFSAVLDSYFRRYAEGKFQVPVRPGRATKSTAVKASAARKGKTA